jgi:phosphopantothenoylcysteine decarboxylase/phosphopantothenate--cysteine ligase
MSLLAGKRVVLGVSGGVAAYKSPDLVRRLREAGADVHVLMTEAATRFVTPLALEVTSGHPVGLSLWDTARDGDERRIAHTERVRDADLVILAPASADLIGRIRHGLADDLLTTAVMAAKTPVLLCPSMNTEMLENPLVADNLAALLALPRYHALPPDAGLLACGVVGPGRLPDPPAILEAAARVLAPKPLATLRLAVSAGPTREPLDPVRYIENHATGTMGFELARALAQLGAEVTLVTGPVPLRTPATVAARVDVTTAAEMRAAIASLWPHLDGLVMAAAVADWRPARVAADKLKKAELASGDGEATLALTPTVDILRELASLPDARRVVRVGFAAETRDVLAYAQGKLVAKDLDFIVANDVGTPGVGFGTGDNAGWLLTRDGETVALPRQPKQAFADALAQSLASRWPSRPGAASAKASGVVDV